MGLSQEVSTSSFGVALTGLTEALDWVIDVVESGGLDELGVMELVNAVQGFERVRSRMALIDHRVVGDCERRQIADELNLRTTRALLVNVLRLSSLEAGRRVRAAAAVGDRTSMVGEPMGPLRAILADAQRQGEVTPEQVAAAEESLRDMEGLDVAPDKVTAAEQTLVEHARAFNPRELSRVGEKLADIAAPDGKAPDDSVLQLKRRFEMATGRDGAIRGKFCLTPDVGAALAAVLSPLAKPRMDPPVGGGHLADAHKDSRTPEQRMHDALGDLCSWALRGGGLATPASTLRRAPLPRRWTGGRIRHPHKLRLPRTPPARTPKQSERTRVEVRRPRRLPKVSQTRLLRCSGPDRQEHPRQSSSRLTSTTFSTAPVRARPASETSSPPNSSSASPAKPRSTPPS